MHVSRLLSRTLAALRDQIEREAGIDQLVAV
jgi:RNA polymerase sigma-B factor